MEFQKDFDLHVFDFKHEQEVSNPETLERIDLTEFDPTALCNDGTHAYFYWKKSK